MSRLQIEAAELKKQEDDFRRKEEELAKKEKVGGRGGRVGNAERWLEREGDGEG